MPMPITKSAKKALRQSLRRRKINQRTKNAAKKAIRECRKNPTAATLKKAYAAIDQAAKKRVFHRNKADRLKSRLAKLVAQKEKETKTKKVSRQKK